MVKLTMIARVTDGLPLAEGLDDGRDLQDADFYKQQVKALFKNLSRGQNEASRMSVETGPYIFHYIIEGRVCYLTMCDRAYPKKLAFQYLEDLKNEFERGYGNQIETAARPYAFIKFDTFIQRTKKLYQDTRTQRNISKLNDELYEVHQIMTRNVQEVLGVGEKLDRFDSSNLMGTPFSTHSCLKKTVTLQDWWLIKPEADDDDTKALGVAGITCNSQQNRTAPTRCFTSAPISKVFDIFELETVDNVSIILQGFINKDRTLQNGFPPEVFKHFVFGFPVYWEEFSATCPKRGSIILQGKY